MSASHKTASSDQVLRLRGASAVSIAVVLLMALCAQFILAPTAADAAASTAPTAATWITNGAVFAIVKCNNGITYIGGAFSLVGPAGGPMQARNNIAAINTATGQATSWNPNANWDVLALAVSGDRVYAGGWFSVIGGQGRNNIAALNMTDGKAVPTWNPGANAAVRTLVYATPRGDGDNAVPTIYAGGQFTQMGGQTRNYVASVNALTGAVTPWNPNASSWVQTLAYRNNIIYAGGLFHSIGGATRNHIATLDHRSGDANPGWDPNANDAVLSIVASGDTVYVGGDFTSIGGRSRNHIAALVGDTASAWNPNANGSVNAVAVAGNTVYAGGPFSRIGGQVRNRLAALNMNTGTATSWNPNANESVFVIEASDTIVYAGGLFTAMGGSGHSYFAQFDVLSSDWYLAEGTTAWGFDCHIAVMNPNSTAVTAKVTYMTDSGPLDGGDWSLKANSQVLINPRDKIGDRDFSTAVACKEGKSIAVDRTMFWASSGGQMESHNSVGVQAPSRNWYLPEGSCNWGFETFLLIQNPNATAANCKVKYTMLGSLTETVNHTIPANSRVTYKMVDEIPDYVPEDASIAVESDVPVIPERSMYRNSRRAGTDSIGSNTLSRTWYLAEGTSAWGFTTYILLQNSSGENATVNITYMTPQGPVQQDQFVLSHLSRKTIRVNDVPGMANKDFSTRIESTIPIGAERSMYWDNGTGEAGHDSIGLTSPHAEFYLPSGGVGGASGCETWTLVQNPNSTEVKVEISYLTTNGATNVTFQDTIAANSRKTYNMADKLPGGSSAAIRVRSLSGKMIMSERAMYWNNKGAGTDTIGGYSD